jgi:hypothetical protein
MNVVALRAYLVEENGNINFAKSLARLEADLLEYQRQRKLNSSLVRRGVDLVFDKYQGAAISMQALTNLALIELKAMPDQYAMLMPALEAYVRLNTGDSSQYKFGKTSGRGFWRWRDRQSTAQRQST